MSSKWAIFGKQNWRCGMNRTQSYGAKVNAHENPQKVLVDLDSRTVAMEVGTRERAIVRPGRTDNRSRSPVVVGPVGGARERRVCVWPRDDAVFRKVAKTVFAGKSLRPVAALKHVVRVRRVVQRPPHVPAVRYDVFVSPPHRAKRVLRALLFATPTGFHRNIRFARVHVPYHSRRRLRSRIYNAIPVQHPVEALGSDPTPGPLVSDDDAKSHHVHVATDISIDPGGALVEDGDVDLFDAEKDMHAAPAGTVAAAAEPPLTAAPFVAAAGGVSATVCAESRLRARHENGSSDPAQGTPEVEEHQAAAEMGPSGTVKPTHTHTHDRTTTTTRGRRR